MRPYVLYESGAGGLRVVAANAAARAAGITPGLTLSDAKARAAALGSEAIDRQADKAALRRLAAWMIRYTPLVALDREDGLMLETTGCDHLFGGEPALMETISRALGAAGCTHRLGLAGTPIAAAALSHSARALGGESTGALLKGAQGAGAAILPSGDEATGLADLPIAALRLDPEAITLLRRFGLTRIGQLYDIDRKALARRFRSKGAASEVMAVLDRALGRRPAPLVPLRPVAEHAANLPCPEPLLDREGLSHGLAELTRTVCDQLTAHGLGAQRFTLRAFRADGTLAACSVSTARPVRTPAHILGLFEEHLDTVDPGYGIDLIRLEARRTGPMAQGMRSLSGALPGRAIDETDLAALADRIEARLGANRVTVLKPADSHRPEQACRRAPFEGRLPDWSETAPTPAGRPMMGPRPLTLFEPPEPVEVIAEVPDGPPLRFVWRRVPRRVTRADGPERIAPEWWTHLPTPDAPEAPQASPSPEPAKPDAPAPDLAPLGASAPGGASKAWLVPKMDPRADAVHIRKARAAIEAAATHPPSPASDAAITPPGGQGILVRRPEPRTRDYYRIEDASGQRYWLFREGLYGDGQGADPAWFVHGVGP